MNLDLNTPACWDHNATINATLPCFGPRGNRFPNCVSIGYYSSAYIVQCGGKLDLLIHIALQWLVVYVFIIHYPIC